MRKIASLFVVCCAVLLQLSGAQGDVGSALGLRETLANCENRNLSPDVRITACTRLLHSNLADQKMEVFLYAVRAQARTEAGDTANALKDYDLALEHYPDYAVALINRGALRNASDRNEEALADFDEAIRLDPTNVTALANRCRVRLNWKKDLDGALADCNAALNLEPARARTLMLRGEVYALLGRCAESNADFESAAKLDPATAQTLSSEKVCQAVLNGTRGGG